MLNIELVTNHLKSKISVHSKLKTLEIMILSRIMCK